MARTARATRKPSRREPEVIQSFDPATLELVGEVPVTAPSEVEGIATEVERIQKGWALVPLPERLRLIRNAAQVLLRRHDDIALAITRENGKTIVESGIVEVANGIATLDWVARWGQKYLSPERLPEHPLTRQKRHWIVYQPLGVVGIISPWNYPMIIPLGEVAQALAAGNGVVLKPSEYTPLAGDLIAEVFAEAGLPEGLLRVIHGTGPTGAALCEVTAVRKVFFTGSSATGRKVMELAAKHGKPVMLELGGKDPAIVCADADLDRAVDGILWGGLMACGQTCAGVERIYVDARVHDDFVEKLVDGAKRIAPGDPRDPETQLGPLNNEMQYDKVVQQLDDAVAKGATAESGGPTDVPGMSGRFFAPVVLTGVDHTMSIMTDETFGPLLPVMRFSSEDEAIRLANDSPYGLGASVWSRDLRRARMLADRIESGMVWINDATYSHGLAYTPWGGVKDSGTGVTHSKHGFYEMTTKRLVAEDPGWISDGWWHPYGETMRRGFKGIIEGLYTEGRRARTFWERRDEIARYLRDRFGRRG